MENQIDQQSNTDLSGIISTLKEITVLRSGVEGKISRESKKNLLPHKESKLIIAIQDIILSIVKDLSENRQPVLIIRNQKLWKNCYINENRLKLRNYEEATTVTIKHGLSPSKDFTHMIYLLGRIYKLLITHSNCTKRELYYENIALFEDQGQLDSVVDKVCCLLDVALWDIGLFATSKGLVSGPLNITTCFGDVIDCSTLGGVSVPQHISSGIQLHSKARFVLVVEKDSTFQKLHDEGFLKHHGPCILVTGKGYPDLNTRMLLKFIWEQLELPILALMDADPYGIEIMCVYRFGSLKQSHISDRLALPSMRWIGVYPSDISELNIDSCSLSNSDRRRIDNLLTRPYISGDSSIKMQLQKLLEEEKKSEIEDISKISKSYLTDVYIPMKIASKQFV